MNKRVLALKKFLNLNCYKLDTKEMFNIYSDIFDFSKRYVLAEGIDIYVDIKHFIIDGVRRIKNNDNVWYKEDFIKAELLENDIVQKWLR